MALAVGDMNLLLDYRGNSHKRPEVGIVSCGQGPRHKCLLDFYQLLLCELRLGPGLLRHKPSSPFFVPCDMLTVSGGIRNLQVAGCPLPVKYSSLSSQKF